MELEIGKWNKLPHYLVVGSPTNFYVWINTGDSSSEQGSSNWIRGAEAFSNYNHLSKLLKRDKKEFIFEVERLFKQYGKAR